MRSWSVVAEMFIDAKEIDDNATLQADLCIIGGGAAGISLAYSLRDSGIEVILLESGGFEFDDKVQDLYETANTGLEYDPLSTRLRYWGGTTNHWGGRSSLIDPIDYEVRPWIPHSGWPINVEDVDPYVAEASDICDLGEQPFLPAAHWAERTGIKPVLAESSTLDNKIYRFSLPTRFGEKYRNFIEEAASTKVILNSNVSNLVTDEGHVESVQVHPSTDKSFEVRARFTVLAAGGIENARLLLNSEVGNQHDQVGRYFMEHPALRDAADIHLFEVDTGKRANYLAQIVDGVPLRIEWALSEATQRAEKLPNTNFRLMPVWEPPAGVVALKEMAQNLKGGHIPDRLGDQIGEVIWDADYLADIAYKTATGSEKGVFQMPGALRVVNVDVAGEQTPDPSSRVILTDKRDWLGHRQVELQWRLNDTDIQGMLAALRLMATEVGRSGLGRAQLHITDEASFHEKLDWQKHHMGTTRMSSDPRHGVVDADCRVHGIDNLYVAGSSVFPTGGAANPTLGIVVLSLRLGRHLRDTMQGA